MRGQGQGGAAPPVKSANIQHAIRGGVGEYGYGYGCGPDRYTIGLTSRSFLLPTNTITMSGLASVLASVSQLFNALYVSRDEMSYTSCST